MAPVSDVQNREQDDPYGFRAVAGDPVFRRDILIILNLPDELLSDVLARCELVSFLGQSALAETLAKVPGLDPGARSALHSALIAFPRLFKLVQEAGQEFGGVLNTIRSAMPDLSEDQCATLVSKLKRLGTPTTSQRMQWKANHLITAVAPACDAFSLITDMRPVFDDDRSSIKGIAPTTTAVVTSADGEEVTLSLSEADLKDWAMKIDSAIRKLNAVKGFAHDRGIDVANVEQDDAR